MLDKIKLHDDTPLFSEIVLGFWRLAEWNLSEQELQALIDKAVELGVTTFDHADIYGGYTCEELFGKVFKNYSTRNSVEIVTKCGISFPCEKRPHYNSHHYNTTKEHIITSAENSLKMLQTDYIDVLLIHRPDPLMNPESTAEGLTKLKQDGKVKHIGVSNFLPHQFDMLQSKLDFKLITNQIEFSPLYVDPLYDGTVNHCQQHGVIPMAWSPFGGGRIFTEDSEKANRVRKELESLAKVKECTIDQIVVAWILNHPAKFAPIIGSGKIERLESAVKGAEIKLSLEEWYSILKAANGVGLP